MKDLYDNRNHSFLSFDNFKNKFGLNNTEFLNYHKLISNIPKEWKNRVNNGENDEMEPQLVDLIIKLEKPNKYLYKRFLLKNKRLIKSEEKWNNVFANLEWKNIYQTVFKSTIDSKLRIFQYKIE